MFQSLFAHHPRDPILDIASDAHAEEIKKRNLANNKPTGKLHWIAEGKEHKYIGQLTSDKRYGDGWGIISIENFQDYEGEVKPLTITKGMALAMSDGFGTMWENGVGIIRGMFIQGQVNGPSCIIHPVDKYVMSSGVWKPSLVEEGSHSDGIVYMYNADGSICQRANMYLGSWCGYGQAIVETEQSIWYSEGMCEKTHMVCGKRIRIDKTTGEEVHMHGKEWLRNEKCLEGKELWFKANGKIDLYPVLNGQSMFHASLNYNCFVPLPSFPRDNLFAISFFLNVDEVNNLCQVSKKMQHLMQPILKIKWNALKKSKRRATLY